MIRQSQFLREYWVKHKYGKDSDYTLKEIKLDKNTTNNSDSVSLLKHIDKAKIMVNKMKEYY